MTHVLAIDIGGTKLAAALVDRAGTVLRSATVPTPREDVFGALARLVTGVVADGPAPVAVGIGCAGPLNLASGTVSPVNITTWRDFPLRERVRELTGLPTVLAGDAQCFALGEHWLGMAEESPSMLGIVVSTGIGGGLVIGGAPLLGPTGNAGHVGHMTVNPDGDPCPCGSRGCVESYASGPNLVRWALANGWTPNPSPDDSTAGPEASRSPDGAMLAKDAASGHPVALAAFERGARALAAMIVSTAAATEVTHVVIGGGVANAGPVLFDPLERAMDELAGFAFVRAVEIRRSKLGVQAALAGAAKLAWSRGATTAAPPPGPHDAR
ncbi:ROK family protein [Nonomuraea africana]|uniref:Glucokinase n=1 Tax=Nonomuraea africana TaxID=46171 RepID=A0ABR9KVH5_9ACTN|nr:ROK family protein [Nonomuraea africana]MBE1565527.1 glucokinase [Nonomuraea africana]